MLNGLEIAAGFVLMAAFVLFAGTAIAAVSRTAGFNRDNPKWNAAAGFLLGLSVLPTSLSLIGRFAGLEIALAGAVMLSLLGVMARPVRKLPWQWVAGALLWVLFVILALVDLDVGGRLYHSSIVRDLTKHVATVRALVDWGIPLTDPYFLRPPPAGYYYFSHILAALPVIATGRWVGAYAAACSLSLLAGIGTVVLALFAWDRCRLVPWTARRAAPLLFLLVLSRNLDIVPALGQLVGGVWPVNIEQWNEQILGWPFAMLWVPHHVLSMIAGMVGLFVLAEPRQPSEPSARAGLSRLGIAGFAFATCVGESVWIGIGIAVTCALWLASLWLRRRWRDAILLAGAGVTGAVLMLPQAFDIVHGRTDTGMPVVLKVRKFLPWDNLIADGSVCELGNLLLLPFNYFLEFGVLLVGGIMFWRERGRQNLSEPERILLFAAIAAMLLGSFTRSVILNNDLGWRVMLLAQFSGLLWTAAVIAKAVDAEGFAFTSLGRWPARLGLLAILGYAGNVYNLVSIRAYPWLGPRLALVDRSLDKPVQDHQLRHAYEWLNANIPVTTVVQHNPASEPYIYDFGLYSRNRVAVSDTEATLYGASREAVKARLDDVTPIFTDTLPPATARSTAEAEHIGVLVVTASDPVWQDTSSWVWATKPIYADSSVRLFAVPDIGARAK